MSNREKELLIAKVLHKTAELMEKEDSPDKIQAMMRRFHLRTEGEGLRLVVDDLAKRLCQIILS